MSSIFSPFLTSYQTCTVTMSCPSTQLVQRTPIWLWCSPVHNIRQSVWTVQRIAHPREELVKSVHALRDLVELKMAMHHLRVWVSVNMYLCSTPLSPVVCMREYMNVQFAACVLYGVFVSSYYI